MKAKKDNIVPKVILLVIALIAIIAIVSIAKFEPKEELPEVYSVGFEHNPENMEDNIGAIVHKREEQLPGQESINFEYDLENFLYALDHPFTGRDCGTIEYSSSYKVGTLTIIENQISDCEEPRNFYITSLIKDHRSFDKIILIEQVNGETVNSSEIKVEEGKESSLEVTP